MNARRLILLLLLATAGIFVLAAMVPEDALSEAEALPVAITVMVLGLVAAGRLAHRLMPGSGMHRVAAWVLVLAVVKLGVGLWYWDTYMYALSDQRARDDFRSSEVYRERAADTAVIDELLVLFRNHGVGFYGAEDTYLPINNRVPAHLTALLVRAFGGQYAGSFPIVAMFAGFASLALAAATVGRVAPWNRRAAVVLAVAWPIGWVVCSVMKDPLLFAAATMIAAYLSVTSGRRDTALGIALATTVLPLFRPAYLGVCGALLGIWLVRSRARLGVRVGGIVAAASVAALVLPFIDVWGRVDGYRAMEDGGSPVMQVPVVGRLVYGLMTPFPWTQIVDDPWRASYVFSAATAVITVAALLAISRRRLAGAWTTMDYGALLAAGMVAGGIASPQIAPGYVQVGTAGLVPLALGAQVPFRRALLVSLGGFLVANAVWLLIR